MAKKPTLHPYSDQQAFDRLLLLIATLVEYPGIGCANENNESSTSNHDALKSVQSKLRELAAETGWQLPKNYPSVATIRKDLGILRQYGILSDRIYRWGYYIGTGALTQEELSIALNALASQAEYQGNPIARRIYEQVSQRVRGLDLKLDGKLLYPVHQQLNRSIVSTDPEEMMERGDNKNTLFHQLEQVETAILEGQAIELSRSHDPYGGKRVGMMKLWPLQMIYHDIAWYLAYENLETGQLAISRMNRFTNYCQVLEPQRCLEIQFEKLQQVHQLLSQGWGLYLGELDEQQAELEGRLEFPSVKVRFFQPVVSFILEGDKRHPSQKIRRGPKNSDDDYKYVDYQVKLPRRSFREFMLWVYRHMHHAKVLSPRELVKQHRQAAKALSDRYQ
jgi:predicted DNA-binding transcriptional regulator YafY